MFKKYITFLVVCMALTFDMRAQDTMDSIAVKQTKYEFTPHVDLGPIGGLMWNQYNITPLYTHHNFYEGYILGYNLGASFLWQPKKWIGLRSDLTLISKAHAFSYAGISGNTVYDWYFQLPIMADFCWKIKQFRIHTDVGLFFGCFATSFHLGEFNSLANNGDDAWFDYSYLEFDRQSIKRFEMGYAATLGVSYYISEHFRILAEGALFYGLSDTYNASPVSPNPAYNTTFGFSLGAYWAL